MIPSLIDFLDVVACDTELHFLDRVSRVAANVIFFCFFFFFFLFHRLEQTVDETQRAIAGSGTKRDEYGNNRERVREREREREREKGR